MPVDEIHPGMEGVGRTVFEGDTIEEFRVEILGILKNAIGPQEDMILARLHGDRVEYTGVVAGMSGSPVYIDGRLAGAVAFSWSFSTGAIAGITPIASMRELSTFPTSIPAALSPTVELKSLIHPELSEQQLDRELRRLASAFSAGQRSPLAWASVGLGDEMRSRLGQALGAITPAGSSPDLEAKLEGGSAVAGVMIDGDLRLAFTGTVTERDGENVLAFGHSFMDLGAVELPMATAEIVTVISGLQSSFKIANIGPVVGAFEQDRFAGLFGRVGSIATTIPLDIRMHGVPAKEFHMELARLPQMTPTLVATSIIQVLNSTRQLNGEQDLELTVKVDLEGHEPLVLEQGFQGNSAGISGAIYALTLMSFIVSNRDEDVTINSIEIDLDQTPRPLGVTLLGAHADRRTVHPGDTVSISMDLREYRGDTYRDTFPVTIPSDAPSGHYYLFLGDGTSVDALRLQMEPYTPSTFAESLDLLRSLHSIRDFVVLGVTSGAGLLVEGRSLPELPASIRSIWRASGPLASKPLHLSIRQESVRTLSRPLAGAARIDLRVQPRTD